MGQKVLNRLFQEFIDDKEDIPAQFLWLYLFIDPQSTYTERQHISRQKRLNRAPLIASR